jgi:hypothetical protein
MRRFVFFAFVLVLVFPSLACNLCGGLNPSGLLGGGNFTTGDFPDVPAYPGATLTTTVPEEVKAITIPFQFIDKNAEWKCYKTADGQQAVVNWYTQNMGGTGWNKAEMSQQPGGVRTEGALVFEKGGRILMIMPIPVEAETFILMSKFTPPKE